LRSLKFPEPDLVLTITGIILISLLTLYSVAGGDFFYKQLAYVVLSLLIVIASYKLFDLSFFRNNYLAIYTFNIVLLIVLKLFGATVLGSQRWLRLGPISIQPSEIAKVCLIICLAVWLSKNPIRGYVDIFKALCIVAVPALLVVIQPDLGTTLVYIAISFGMLFWAGAKLVELLVLISPLVTAILSSLGTKLFAYQYGRLDFAITVPVAVFLVFLFLFLFIYYQAWASPWRSSLIFLLLFGNGLVMIFRSIAWGLLKEYQQKRLTIFLDPYIDPLGAGYHIIQSLYAIGSGGFFGQGLQNGDLTQGEFVPEQHTDFIFSAVGEEFGFLGTIIVVGFYTVLCLKLVSKAQSTDDRFVSLLIIGTLAMEFFHIFVNIGMNLSIMPITGVPLPFLSYGGSSMIVNLFLISLIIKGTGGTRRHRAYY